MKSWQCHGQKSRRITVLLIGASLGIILLCYPRLPSPDVYDKFSPQNQPVTHDIHKFLSKVIPPRRENRVDCSAIINGNMQEINKADRLSLRLRSEELQMSPESYIELASECSVFLKTRGYIMSPLTREEFEFPIAFSIVITEDIEMAERLLRAIYRPQNYYCVHVDGKSDDIFKVFLRIASCLSNVILPNRRLVMTWGTFSVLEAELICMETLWPFTRWKYFINLTGKEFPLKTNSDLVQILKSLDGANDVHANFKETYSERWRYHYHYPPSWFRPVKGSVHMAASRPFVSYLLHNETASMILSWVKTLKKFHDEVYFATMNHNPHLMVPGSYNGDPEFDEKSKPHLSRYKVWNTSDCYFCAANRWEKYICILTSGDLPLMLRSVHLFANKFFLHEDRIAISCLEEWIYNTTRDNFLRKRLMDFSYYENLDIVNNQIRIKS